MIQIGTRASESEAIFSDEDDRVETWYAREIWVLTVGLGINARKYL